VVNGVARSDVNTNGDLGSWSRSANYSVSPTLKLFVLRGVSDEASLTLAAGRIGAKLSNPLWQQMLAIGSFLVTAPMMIGTARDWSSRTHSGGVLLTLVLIGVVMCFLVLLAPNFCNAAFGREFLVGASRAEVEASSVPDASQAVVKTLGPHFDDLALRHYLYDHPDCIPEIGRILSPTSELAIVSAEISALQTIKAAWLLRRGKTGTSSKRWRHINVAGLWLLGIAAALYVKSLRQIDVLEADLVRVNHKNRPLLGCYGPSSYGECEGERAQAKRASVRVTQLLLHNSVKVQEVSCPCRRGRGTETCKYRSGECAQITIDGEDLANVLIREGYSRALSCDKNGCSARRSWC
jgi:hypothetical protein